MDRYSSEEQRKKAERRREVQKIENSRDERNKRFLRDRKRWWGAPGLGFSRDFPVDKSVP